MRTVNIHEAKTHLAAANPPGPFGRILVAHAQIEAITLLTTDEIVARYPGPIRML